MSTCLWGEELDWLPPFSQFFISLFVPSSSFSNSTVISLFFFLLSPFSTAGTSPLVSSFTTWTSSSSKVGASKGNLENNPMGVIQNLVTCSIDLLQISLQVRSPLWSTCVASWEAVNRWRWRKWVYLTCLSRAWLRTSRASWATCEQIIGSGYYIPTNRPTANSLDFSPNDAIHLEEDWYKKKLEEQQSHSTLRC